MPGMTEVQALGAELWTWRLATCFRTSDDIPRVDRTDVDALDRAGPWW